MVNIMISPIVVNRSKWLKRANAAAAQCQQQITLATTTTTKTPATSTAAAALSAEAQRKSFYAIPHLVDIGSHNCYPKKII